MYYTYIIRCEDNSLYTGITTDLDRRMKEHFNKTEKCAKYTLRHTPKKLEAVWESENRVLASKLEYNIKRLKKIEKEELIENNTKIKELLDTKVEIEKYNRVNIKDVK